MEPKKIIREMPRVSENHRMTVPELGVFHGQSVGSTAYTTGYDIYFQREGKEGREGGYMRFACKINENFEVVWVLVAPGYPTSVGNPFSPAVYAWGERMADSLKDRDPVGFMFHVIGALEMEYREHDRLVLEVKRAIDQYTDLLRDPQSPRTMYVKAADEDANRTGRAKGTTVPSTEEHREEMRTWWTTGLAKARAKLEALTASSARVDRMKATSKAITAWAHKSSRKGSEVVQIITQGLKEEVAHAA